MAQEGIKLGLVLVLVAMFGYEAMAQSGCTRVLMNLAPCLNYITGNSSTPSSSCCSQLASVVQSQPQCLCAALNGGGSSLGLNINQTLALSLPGACNVQTPPISRCNGASGPTAAPAGSPDQSPPADSSDDTPDTTPAQSVPNIPSVSGSKTVPSTTGSTSNASNTRMLFNLVVFAFFLASCVSSFIAF